MPGEGFLLEVCVDSLHGALEAERGGAGRLELCGSIHATGGVTPSYGLMKLVKSRVRIPVHVLIRPRAGDFVYSDLDLDVMQADIHTVAQFGFQGVAIGALTPSRDVDVKAMHLLLQAGIHAVLLNTCYTLQSYWSNYLLRFWFILTF